MRITNIEKINPISFESIIISSRVFTALVVFTFLFFFFSSVSAIIIIFHIPDVYATLDTFYARGTIFIPIGDSNSSNSDTDTKTQLLSSLSSSLSSPNQSTTSINNNNNSINNTTNTNTNNIITKEEQNNNNMSKIKNIKGQWTLKVNKGSPQIFNTLLVSYDQNGIPKNAYGIYNLRDVKFIQLDNQGNEIINGKVDLRSVGVVNKTITGIDATFIIERLQKMQIILNNGTSISNNYYHYFFNKPIIGKIILMADGIGNILVDKRPKASSVPVPPDVTPTPPNLPPYPHRQPYSSPQNSPNSPSLNAVPSDSKLPPSFNTPDTKIR